MQQNTEDRDRASQRLLEMVRQVKSETWGRLWPKILADHHVTLTEASRLAVALAEGGFIAIEPLLGRRRTLKDENRLRVISDGTTDG